MLSFLIKRILLIFVIVLAIILIMFILLYTIPGSFLRFMPINSADGDMLDTIFEHFNASNNFFTQYIRYCYNVFFRFNLGFSASTNYRLTRELSYRVTNTLAILACGVGATFLLGIPIGVYSAVHRNGKRDRVINTVTLFFSAIPTFAMAMMVVLTLAVYLRVLPVITTYRSPVAYIMPTITISLGGIALIARTTRASMLEVLEQPFITALRSKGLKERDVVYKHAFKNALIPVVSVTGGFISQMFCGTFVVEQFFNVPGLGSYMLRSVGQRDHFEMLGCTVIIAIFLATTNILADIIYAFINPQIRLRYARSESKKLRKEVAG